MINLDADGVAAAAIAYEAGQLLLSIRPLDHSSDASADGDSADVKANKLILKRLDDIYPDDAILSEESADGPQRLQCDRVWIIDPLDGTREYGQPLRDDWAVHVALLQGGSLRAGAVALPAKAMLFSTLSQFSCPTRIDGPLRLAVSRTRPPAEAQKLEQALGAILVPMGSAGAKTMAVVRGEVDGYVHAGGQYEWDSAAPVAIAQANGLHATRIDGSPFQWNQENPWQPDLLICRPECASLVLHELGH